MYGVSLDEFITIDSITSHAVHNVQLVSRYLKTVGLSRQRLNKSHTACDHYIGFISKYTVQNTIINFEALLQHVTLLYKSLGCRGIHLKLKATHPFNVAFRITYVIQR